MEMLHPLLERELELSGFALVEGLVTAAELGPLREEADRLLAASAARGGVRGVLEKSALLRGLAAEGAPARLAAAVLGPDARPTRLTLFDKSAGANWTVAYHQDLTIAVAQRVEVEGFGPWSVKEGVPHVQAPTAVLEGLLALRLHLDETPADNGALRVLPGTHRFGRLSDAQVASFRKEVPQPVCGIAAGGAMLMRPLLLHASSPAVLPARRRVLHFEYAGAELPGGLCWS